MAITRQGLTLEEFLKLPEEKPALEYLQGKVTQKVSPQFHHSRIQSFLVAQFTLIWEAGQIASAFSELRATYGGASTVPDVSVYRWDRLPLDPRGRLAVASYEPPDIAIEIVSPDQSLRNLIDRCLWYVDNGVHLAILIHPERETIRLFRPGQRPNLLRRDERIVPEDVLPGFDLTVEDLFQSLYYRR